jgi:hypothetical protein
MTTHVTVTLRCDAAQAPDCHREYSTEGHTVPATVFVGVKEAQDAGWRKDWTLAGETDVCPACVASRESKPVRSG